MHLFFRYSLTVDYHDSNPWLILTIALACLCRTGQVAMISLPAPAESLCLVHMAAEQAAGGSNEQLFLYIGLTSGVCQRVTGVPIREATSDGGHIWFSDALGPWCCLQKPVLCSPHVEWNWRGVQVAVDATAGTLSDPRQRFLGSKPVKLFRIKVQDKRGVSSFQWCRHVEYIGFDEACLVGIAEARGGAVTTPHCRPSKSKSEPSC